MILITFLVLVIAAVGCLIFVGGLRFGYVKAERDIALRELKKREARG